MNGFLWGRGATGKGVKWMTWARMFRPKGCGGLGVRELRKFNVAMLAKQCGRLLQESNVLESTIIKGQYYPNTSFLEAEVGKNPSYVWRRLMELWRLSRQEPDGKLELVQILRFGIYLSYQMWTLDV